MKMKQWFWLLLLLVCVQPVGARRSERKARLRMQERAAACDSVRSLIYMIGDGMGLAHVSLLQISEGYENRVAFDRAENIALIRSYSANNRVTDSGAAGTALATGHKTNNDMLGVLPDSTAVESMMEKAVRRGMTTGIVTTCYINHATPGAFYGHQIYRRTLEPIADLKIDLTATRTRTQNNSIQYMYAGMPTTQSGSFNMTTISIGSAFEKSGNADNGYFSKTFAKFQNSLDRFQQRAEARYAGGTYPEGTGMTGTFNPENGTVDKYSADVLIPAFLSAYSGGNSMDIFPSLLRMMPNWSLSYKGLGNLPWIKDHFRSVTLTHGYPKRGFHASDGRLFAPLGGVLPAPNGELAPQVENNVILGVFLVDEEARTGQTILT